MVTDKTYKIGMRGVFLVAAELARCGLIVSPTSRGAAGADLLVTTDDARKTFSVQVKTMTKGFHWWVVGRGAKRFVSPSHAYVFVNIRPSGPEYFIVPSKVVSRRVKPHGKNEAWLGFNYVDAKRYRDNWEFLGARGS